MPHHPMSKIEKGVPIPRRSNIGPRAKRGHGRISVLAMLGIDLADMSPGDSFLVADPAFFRRAQNTVRSTARALGIRLVQRRMDDGLRFWRVA